MISSRIIALVIKELLTLFRDPKSRFVLIAPPILQLFIFAYAATLEVKNIELAIYNQDKGKQSSHLITQMQGSPFFRKILFLRSQNDIQTLVDEQTVTAVMQIPSNFSAKLDAGEPVALQLILDGRRSNASQIINGYITEIILRFNRMVGNSPPSQSAGVAIIDRSWFNPNLSYQWFTVPSLVCILSMLIVLMITSLSVARERELGTFDQLLVSPLSPREILIGKTIPAIIIGSMEAGIIWLAAMFIFHIPFTGSVTLMALVLTIFNLSTVGVGLFISSMSATQQQAVLGTFVFMVPAVTLSGYASPIENMPEWLQMVTNVNPLKFALVAVKGIFLKDMPFALVWQNTWPMLIIASVTLPVAGWYFRKRVE
jgi:ABC-2 type transport system permease protein